MAWIELHQSLWTHRKTYDLADELGINETYAAAHLAKLWCWALDNAPTGDLSGVKDAVLARAAGWSGDATVFVSALIQSGWITGSELHDWHDYAGRLVERRQANTERMRAARAERVFKSDDARAKNVQRTTVARAGATVPNPTVPNHDSSNEESSFCALSAESTPEEVSEGIVTTIFGEVEPADARPRRVTESYRAEMRAKFPNLDEATEWDRASNHVAYRKAIDKRRYYLNWLKNAEKYQRERRSTNGRDAEDGSGIAFLERVRASGRLVE